MRTAASYFHCALWPAHVWLAASFQPARPIPRLAIVLLLALADQALAQITVEGIQDRQVVADRARFRVVAAAGFVDEPRLDGALVAAGDWVDVAAVDYHELQVRRVPAAGGAAETRLFRFIVRSSERADTEWGLRPWTPPPVINSSVDELAGAQLQLLTPSAWPAGMEMPVAAMLLDPAGGARRANARLPMPGGEGLQLRRGAGGAWLPKPVPGTTNVDWWVRTNGLSAQRSIPVLTNVVWRSVGGAVLGAAAWAAEEHIEVTNQLTIPVGATLTIGPGVIVRLAAGIDVLVQGRLRIEGEVARPVVWTPVDRTQPWGGFVVRGPDAELTASSTIFARSGANANWFAQNPGYDVHRQEQALFLVDGARLALTNGVAFDLAGQFGHGKNGQVTLDHCLVQRCITGGEYNGGSVRIRDSWLLECPRDDATFADADNDGIYFTTGTHEIRDSVVGWTKDDGIDHGSGGAGTLTLSNVWVEGTFHEAFAWSGGGRVIRMTNCVAFHCGQGIEAGWSSGAASPDVFADHCLSLGNEIGARFGDNYDWSYDGFLRVTNSFLLFNHRDVWGMNWDDWTYRTNQMDLRGNFVSATNPLHPGNAVWDGAADGWRLGPFRPTPADAAVGAGLALREPRLSARDLGEGVPVALSAFATNPVVLRCEIQDATGRIARELTEFLPGETLKRVALPAAFAGPDSPLRVSIVPVQGAEVSGLGEAWFFPAATNQPAESVVLVPTGAVWSYLDDGSNAGTAWRDIGFNDDVWKQGHAELGYGDGDEVTTVSYGTNKTQKFVTTYFRHAFSVADPGAFSRLLLRLKRDDGGVVYLNGDEVFRSNMSAGAVTFETPAANTAADDGKDFFAVEVSLTNLRPGPNLLAVEIHQDKRDSSDISFDCELVGFPSAAPPQIQWAAFGPQLLLWWNDSNAVLEASSQADGRWEALPASDGYALVPMEAQRFFRLRRP